MSESRSMWPPMRELKKAMMDTGDKPGFVVRLIAPAYEKGGKRIKNGYDDYMLCGPLDKDLFERLKKTVVDIFIEQNHRAEAASPAAKPEGMRLSDFQIGTSFWTVTGEWRCTDIGRRTVTAIKLNGDHDPSWFSGPPYAVAEEVFDEDSIKGCYATKEEAVPKIEAPDLGEPILGVPMALPAGFVRWMGVDLDKTLAKWTGETAPCEIGEPIPKMVARVRGWISRGIEVRIFTARLSPIMMPDGPDRDVEEVRAAIEKWCEEHIGHRLPVTNIKDHGLIELWDDRAIQVRPNAGTRLVPDGEGI
jgi:hypothetical protein